MSRERELLPSPSPFTSACASRDLEGNRVMLNKGGKGRGGVVRDDARVPSGHGAVKPEIQ